LIENTDFKVNYWSANKDAYIFKSILNDDEGEIYGEPKIFKYSEVKFVSIDELGEDILNSPIKNLANQIKYHINSLEEIKQK